MTIDEGLIALGNFEKAPGPFFSKEVTMKLPTATGWEGLSCQSGGRIALKMTFRFVFSNDPLERKSKTYLSVLVGDFVLPPKSAKNMLLGIMKSSMLGVKQKSKKLNERNPPIIPGHVDFKAPKTPPSASRKNLEHLCHFGRVSPLQALGFLIHKYVLFIVQPP